MPSPLPTNYTILHGNTGDDWTPVDAVTIWTTGPDATEVRLSTARMHDLDDHVDVKVSTDRLDGADLPADLSGCECLVSETTGTIRDPSPEAGVDDDEQYYGTISDVRTVAHQTILSVPTDLPAVTFP